MMVITQKHVGAVLMQILILLLNQFSCASVGNKTLIIQFDMLHISRINHMHSIHIYIYIYIYIYIFKVQQIQFCFMDVNLLYSTQQHVSASHVPIFRVVKTRIQI